MNSPSIIRPVRIVRADGSSLNLGEGGPESLAIVLSGSADPGRPASFGSSILIDFGREMFGSVRFGVVSVAVGELARLRVRLGESVGEAEAPQGCYCDFDRVASVGSGQPIESGPSGFRFLRLDLLDVSNTVELALPEALAIERDLPLLGAFESSDDRLNRIWEAGARTVHLCMQDLIWDGIKRGRTVWAGDLHPALAVIAAAFGPQPVVAASLDWLQQDTSRRPGRLEWMNDIPAYSLWWVISLAEWYLSTGDRADLEARHSYLADLLAMVDAEIDAEGREDFAGWRYLDWSTTRDFDAIHVGYQGLTAWALRSAGGIARSLGDPSLERLSAQILARVESYRPPLTSNKQARALLVLGGLAEPLATNREVLAIEPTHGLTPFLGYHVLEARALAADHAGALALIRNFWGGMLDLGATTFWEDYRDSWASGAGRIDQPAAEGFRDVHGTSSRGYGLSLCHAWSAGPTAWLSRHVLGVQPIEPGCRVVRIRPYLGDLDHVEGRFPTPQGILEVRHRKRTDGSIASDVVAPEGVRVQFEG
jgi:alpha-L-rhamnosidase